MCCCMMHDFALVFVFSGVFFCTGPGKGTGHEANPQPYVGQPQPYVSNQPNQGEEKVSEDQPMAVAIGVPLEK